MTGEFEILEVEITASPLLVKLLASEPSKINDLGNRIWFAAYAGIMNQGKKEPEGPPRNSRHFNWVSLEKGSQPKYDLRVIVKVAWMPQGLSPQRYQPAIQRRIEKIFAQKINNFTSRVEIIPTD